MSVAFDLTPEHQAELDRICREHREDPPSGRVPSKPHRYDKYVEPAVPETVLKALRANPMADAVQAPKPARTQVDHAERLRAFAEAVASKFVAGDRVSIAMAAEAAGVNSAVAFDCIAQLRSRGAWPYERGAMGSKAKVGGGRKEAGPDAPRKPGRRVGSLRLDGLDLAGGRPESAPVIKATPAVKVAVAAMAPAEPAAVKPAPAAISTGAVSGDLGGLAARLRRAADLIDQAAAILGGGS